MNGECNGCGRCCEEFNYLINEEDLRNWYYDSKRDNTDILEKIRVEIHEDLGGDRFQAWNDDGFNYCEMKFELGEDIEYIEISMRMWEDDPIEAFEGEGPCWFYETENKRCTIHDRVPEVCRQYFCKSGKGTDYNLLTTGGYIIKVPYGKSYNKLVDER